MRGKHHIIIESARLKYEFEIKRNITIIQGDSATGKTTLIDLLSDYQKDKEKSPVRIESDAPCEVFSGSEDRWRATLELITDSIVFIDEGNHFIRSKEFAEVVKCSTNYFVLITRDVLPSLPYSIREIYGIRTSGKYHFPEKIYHEFYPIYGDICNTASETDDRMIMITEDSNSGNQYFQSFFKEPDNCIGAGGNSRIYSAMRKQDEDQILSVVADGAAFGAFAARVLEYAEERGKTMLFLPESFEWLILKSGVATDKSLEGILERPEDYIDSSEYMSWEQFFTEQLESITSEDDIRRYQKSRLSSYYTSSNVKSRILQMLPDQLKKALEEEEKKKMIS
ncbi:MAG: translation initiation factor 2 [Mogibacterium sp.]|nr:translation initiation factor 2 [Mogibacterium sp.]